MLKSLVNVVPFLRTEVFCTCLVLGLSSSAWAQYHMEVVARQELKVKCLVSASSRSERNSAYFVLPALPLRETQKLYSMELSVPIKVVSDESDPPKNLVAAWITGEATGDASHHRYSASLELNTQLLQRQLVPGSAPAAVALSQEEEARFLSVSPTLNWQNPKFTSWLASQALQRDLGEAPLAYGRRLYDFLLKHSNYEYPPPMGWEAAATCCRLCSDCGGLSGVFVAACRANHVPARLLIGQWFRLQRMAGKPPGVQPHVYAEFFDPKVGWVPVDIASGLLLANDVDARPDYFGVDPPFFLVLTYDTDFRVNTPSDGLQKIQWMQNPNLWFDHKNSDRPSVNRHWSYTVVDSGQ